MKKTVDVSIVAANYNNEKFLVDFFESIKQSTVYPAELLVIDDGSTDNSLEIIKQYADLRFLKIIVFERNFGFTTALNSGIDIATSKYIMRADPDDILAPERIEKQFVFMETNPDIDMVGCNVQYFNDINKQLLNKSNFPALHSRILKSYKKGEHGLQHPTVCGKTVLFKKYRYGKIFPGEDYEIFARMAKNGIRFANITEILYLMRIHGTSSTSTLKFSGIKQTFQFRDSIFGSKTSILQMWLYYNYIKNYRAYQLNVNILKKYYHLALAVLFYPTKLFKRCLLKL